MVPLFIVFLFVALAVLSAASGADSRRLERRTDWPFHGRPSRP
jgi:hypothetical protein